LRRAVKDAQKLARNCNVPLYYWKNGKVVARNPLPVQILARERLWAQRQVLDSFIKMLLR
jgi:hypothetical protein